MPDRPLLKLGDRGAAVLEWQRLLLRDGYDLGATKADEEFGKLTHNATIAWEWAHGLPRNGVVEPDDWRAMLTGVGPEQVPTERSAFDLDRLPYVEAANWTRSPRGLAKRLIVLHCMEIAESATTAEACARFFANQVASSTKGSSAHICCDVDSAVLCVPTDCIAWHAPGANKDGIGVELAGFARQTRAQWLDLYSATMLRTAAKIVRALGRRHGIPMAFVDAEGVRGGVVRGVTTHATVTEAFPDKGTHWDPGTGFPMDQFLEWARAS